tara:strand:- start:341 stop:868 length:528 start_codon:yes stop_codon:yes gene_type:complete
MADRVTLKVQGIKEIEQMFKEVPKQVNQDSIWAKFWRLNSKPLVKAAQQYAPIAKEDIPYPPNPSLTIKRGTLRDSIGFFRTKASKNFHGGYVGPRVKGKYKKEKGGFFGAWVEYGDEVMHYGKFKGKANPFMHKAWKAAHKIVLENGFKDSEIIFKRVIKSHERRLKKYGRLGY